jgi:hypothetical protein
MNAKLSALEKKLLDALQKLVRGKQVVIHGGKKEPVEEKEEKKP